MKVIWKSRPELLARLIVSGLLIVVLLSAGCASKGAYRVSQAAYVTTQAADWDSTRRALAHGARERNPLVPESPIGLAAVKAAQVALVLLLADTVESRGQRAVATTLLTAISVVIGLVAAHNYRVGGE